jgi:hypothetical protein
MPAPPAESGDSPRCNPGLHVPLAERVQLRVALASGIRRALAGSSA